MTGVVIVRERCAKTDPPEVGGNHVTDQGCLYWNFDGWLHDSDRIADPQPSVWFDFPRDTERETLTTEDVDLVCYWVETMSKVIRGVNPGLAGPTEAQEYLSGAVARLRAALDALDTKDDS